MRRKVAIGFAGTAKNTGKTTTLNTVIAQLEQVPGIRRALTSIGYDGEDFDNITGLPKPRVHVAAGDLAAVTEGCVDCSAAGLEVLQTTGIKTPMGKVLICRVTAPGLLVLAGPNKGSELRRVLELLYGTGADIVLVDGALGRIAPMAETDGVILATGASRNVDIEALCRESGSIVELLRTPALEARGRVAQVPSVLGETGFSQFLSALAEADTVLLQGLLGEPYLQALSTRTELVRDKCILFQDAFKLLLTGDAGRTRADLRGLAAAGARVGVCRAVPVIAVTANPYYPRYRVTSQDYEPSYVDKDALLSTLRDSTGAPCYNVVEEGGAGLLEQITALWSS